MLTTWSCAVSLSLAQTSRTCLLTRTKRPSSTRSVLKSLSRASSTVARSLGTTLSGVLQQQMFTIMFYIGICCNEANKVARH